MKKDNSLKDVFSASLNLSMSHMDKESFERFNKIIDHSSRTINILVISGIALLAACYFLNKNGVNLFGYIPGMLLLFLYARYKDLHKLSLDGIKNLNKKSEPPG